MILFASCMPVQTATPSPQPSAAIVSISKPTSTFVIPTQTATLHPTVTPTATAIPCDPFTADFCITDGNFILQRPILPSANDSVDRTYPFASTADGTRDPHHGVEFVNAFGTPVYAAGDGSVIFAGLDDVAIYSPWRVYYGNLVVIEHEDNLFTLYAHLSKIDVKTGDLIAMGDKIGEVGQSGVAIGSHLHFEVRRGDVEDYFSTVNSELWLTPRTSNSGAIEFSIVNENSQFQKATITVQHVDESNNVLGVYYIDTYHPTLTTRTENAAIGDLSAGRYRITLIHNGGFYERWVEVQSSKLTQVVIVVK